MKNIDHYILRTLLAGSFGGSPDGLIDNCIRYINETRDFVNRKIFTVIESSGRSLKISEQDLLSQCYSKKNDLHLIFNIWYQNINYNPSYSGNELQIDHIFPTSKLKEIKIGDSRVMRYKKEDRDQIANLMLLTREENGAAGKRDMEPLEWFKNKDTQYLKRHLIPEDRELWKIKNFDRFVSERKKLIIHKFKNELGLLIQPKRK